MRLLLVVAAASFLKILSPTLISPYGLPGPPPPGGVCSQFRALLLPIFRFFRLSPSSSFRLTLPLSLAVGSVTLFGNRLQFGRFCSRPDFCSLFSSALLLSLSFRPPSLSLSLVFSVLSLSSYVFAPHLSFTLSLSPFVSLLVSLLISLPVPRCAQPLQEGPAVLFLRSAIDFVSSVFCTGCTGMKAGTYS